MEMRIKNAVVVTRHDVFRGGMLVRDGSIADIDTEQTSPSIAEDFEGDYLLPGFVEIHTDNLEKHVMPRPGVRWPMWPAVTAHDIQVAASGITTVCDALSLVGAEESSLRADMLTDSINTILQARKAGILRSDHYLHLRCEVSTESVCDTFRRLLEFPSIRLVSLMDHTPGQRQFTDLTKYRQYFGEKYQLDANQLDALITERKVEQQKFAQKHRREITALSQERGIALASHDDTTVDHIREALDHKVTISEFPTTLEAARAARDGEMAIVMGGPNIVCGRSHSGNISASVLAENALLDILSSDYVPQSLVQAAFILFQSAAVSLPDAIAMISAAPADALGMKDRGRLEVGRRADLVRLAVRDGLPVIRSVWRAGNRVA